MRAISHLAEISGDYDIILSDIWGVLHNGLALYPGTISALKQARASGKTIILITNAPRPAADVIAQVDGLGLPRETYDGIVTSGDVTRALIADMPKKLLHIGPERDLSLFDGLDIELVEEDEAQAVICTGFYERDNEEDPENYLPLLRKLRSRNLPFVCANPDIIVHIGDQELWCAGALARLYEKLGGRTLIAGKPHAPIYAQALAKAAKARGLASADAIDRSRVLVMGDGLPTDIQGANNQGLDCVFIAGGIHINDYSENGRINADKLAAYLAANGVSATAFMPELA